MTKRCSKCLEMKPLDDFYAHPGTRDGRLGKCKPCAIAEARANQAKKSIYYRAYARARYRRLTNTT